MQTASARQRKQTDRPSLTCGLGTARLEDTTLRAVFNSPCTHGFDVNHRFLPGMRLPDPNADPPGGRACGAIAEQPAQAAGIKGTRNHLTTPVWRPAPPPGDGMNPSLG
jgi:hypothetical protein